MPFFLDAQEATQRFGDHIAEFSSLLDANHLRHGAPDDLFEFAGRLESSHQFRVDLAALARSVMRRERDELLLTDMVSIIAAAVGGPSIAETRRDITRPTNVLMEFLLGTGCWRQFGSASRASAAPVRQAVEEPRPLRVSPWLTQASVVEGSEEPESRASLLGIAKELRETLARLESNAQEVRVHLDAIEGRINRMKAAPEAPVVRPSPELEPLRHRSVEDMAAASVVQPVAESTFAPDPELRSRAIFSHVFPPEELQSDDDFTAPTFAYASEKGRGAVLMWIFVVLLVIAGVSFFFVHFGARGAWLSAGISRLKDAGAVLHRAPATSGQTPATAPATSTTGAAAAPPAAVPPAAQAPAGPVTPAGNAAGGTVAPAATDGSDHSGSSAAGVASDRSGARRVGANVMEGYLLSAPRPEYPAGARANRVEGQVVLQATISKSGSIEALHVIKGPSSLRAAAVDAVRKWRYRPYVVNGRPVDVATTVYVNFSLRPPPTIVH